MNKLLKLLASDDSPVDHRLLLKDTGWFSSKRFLLVIAALAGFYYVGQILSSEILKYSTYIICTYIAGESLSKSVMAVCNTIVRVHEMRHPEFKPGRKA